MEIKMNHQLVNIMSAELLGHKTFKHDKCESCSVSTPNSTKLFNIFTNPTDCLDVVKVLGQKHKIYIAPLKQQWFASHMDGEFDTYEEAVGAAVLIKMIKENV